MRISDFNNYPNFFFLNNNKYLLKITKEKNEVHNYIKKKME